MKQVLVLGGTRFFGIHLVKSLLEQGAGVTLATRGLTPDPFGSRVNRIRVDRTDPDAMKAALQGARYDVVFDDVAYCSNDVKNLLDSVSAERLVQVSSASVYPDRPDTPEEEFDPFQKELVWCDRTDFDYGEGKRQAAVSYTHLDVYKRQVVGDADRRAGGFGAVIEGLRRINERPVSGKGTALDGKLAGFNTQHIIAGELCAVLNLPFCITGRIDPGRRGFVIVLAVTAFTGDLSGRGNGDLWNIAFSRVDSPVHTDTGGAVSTSVLFPVDGPVYRDNGTIGRIIPVLIQQNPAVALKNNILSHSQHGILAGTGFILSLIHI